jgi:hypothetical protein
MNDEEKRVRTILQITFKKLDEVLAQQVMEKGRRPSADRRKQQGKQRPGEQPVGDEVEIS